MGKISHTALPVLGLGPGTQIPLPGMLTPPTRSQPGPRIDSKQRPPPRAEIRLKVLDHWSRRRHAHHKGAETEST